MERLWTHVVMDGDWEVRKFLSLREARHFAERNNLTVKATGVKPQTQRDLYKKALLECGECLFQEYYYGYDSGRKEGKCKGKERKV